MKPTGQTFAYNATTRDRVGTREGPTTRRARKTDAAWFAKRPHRTIRFRDPLPNELVELSHTEPPSEVQGYPARQTTRGSTFNYCKILHHPHARGR